MNHYNVKDQTGVREAQEATQSISTYGVTTEGVVDTGVVVTTIDATAGLVIVSDLTTTDTAIFAIKDVAGTVSTQLLVTQANFTAAKAGAGTINVYIETGVVKVQNLSGGTIDINVKAIV